MDLSSDDDFESLRPKKRVKREIHILSPQKSHENTAKTPTKTANVDTENKLIQDTIPPVAQTEKEPELSCPVCNVDLTHVTPDLRATHVNFCLDGNPLDPWGDLLLCVCGINMTEWTTSRKQVHLHRCLDSDSDVFGKVLTCPACRESWQMSTTIPAKIKHLRKCAQENKLNLGQLVEELKEAQDDFMKPTLKPLHQVEKKPLFSKRSSMDEDLQLALALSKSLLHQQVKTSSTLLPVEQAETLARKRMESHLKRKADSELWKRSAECPCTMPHLVITPLLTSQQIYDKAIEERKRVYLQSIEFLKREMDREVRLLMKERIQMYPTNQDEEDDEMLLESLANME
jgi:hypothetical protein